MRKTLGKRLISGVTAALTAVMIFPNVMPTTLAAGGNPQLDAAKKVFSLDRDGDLASSMGWMINYKYADQLYAEIDFPQSVDIPAQSYYLLVHAEGMDTTPFEMMNRNFKYNDGEDRDYYKLYELSLLRSAAADLPQRK